MKNILIIIAFLVTINNLNAQISIGLNANFELPTNSYNEVRNGMGANLLLAYSFKQNFDLNVGVGNTWMNSLIENYQINAYELGINYYFINKPIKPYISLSGGYYIKNIRASFNNNKISEKGLGVKPRIGCLFDLKTLKGFKINAQLYYNKAFTEHQISVFGLNIGLLYFFNTK